MYIMLYKIIDIKIIYYSIIINVFREGLFKCVVRVEYILCCL